MRSAAKRRRRVKQIAPDTIKYWEGRVLTLTKFNRPLTDEEVARIMAGEDPTTIPGCTGHYDYEKESEGS